MLAHRGSQRRALLVAVLAIAAAIAAWNVPALDFLLYPIRLFVTFVHEAGHGLAAILTGGRFVNLTVLANGSGVASTIGGWRWIIIPAGYIGAALFGAGLLYLANRTHRSRAITGVLAAVIGVITLAFTGWFSTAWLVGLGMAAVLGLLAWKAREEVCLWVLNFLAVVCCLNAVVDVTTLIGSSNIALGQVRNDAAAFSAEVAPLIPPWVWAICWSGIALILLGAAIWFGILRKARSAL
jgi:hypothetical protein